MPTPPSNGNPKSLHPEKPQEKFIWNNEEEFSFRPLTEGLGFHQTRSKVMQEFMGTRAPTTKSTPISRPSSLLPPEVLSASSHRPTIPSQMPLPSFPNSSPPPKWQQCLAWLVDMWILFFLITLTIGPFILILGTDRHAIENVAFHLSAYVIVIFCIYYFCYFSFLDLTKTGTLGKSLFQLKLQSQITNKPLSLTMTFLRSFIVLFSSILLFIPMILDLQSKMTQTCLSKRKK